MTEQAAKALAAVLAAESVRQMPSTRTWGVILDHPDGRVVALEDQAGWVYRDRDAYDDYHKSGNSESVADAREWGNWGTSEEWATSLARLLGGEAHQSGGNIWVVLYSRPDGQFIVIGDDGAEIYESAEHYERYYEAVWPEPEFVYWSDLPAKT